MSSPAQLLAAAGPAPGMAPEMADLSILALARLLGDTPDGAGPFAASHAAARLECWLTPVERTTYHSFDLPKRRRDWLAGRIAAKDLVRRRHGLEGDAAFQAIEIHALHDGPRRGRPVYRLHGRPGPYCLAISHSGDTALSALARERSHEVGIDLEAIEPREPSFEALVLSPAEVRRLRGLQGPARWLALTRIWVLKEALSKALGTGLRLALPGLYVAADPETGALEPRPFRAVAAAGRPHPLLAGLDRWHMAAHSFPHGGRLAAWVVLSPPEEP